jgi:hypothetical protein
LEQERETRRVEEEEEGGEEEREVRGTSSTSPAEPKKKGECGARGITPLSNRCID